MRFATIYRLDGPGIEHRQKQESFFSQKAFRAALKSTQLPLQWVKIKESRKRAGVAQRVPGCLGSQIS